VRKRGGDEYSGIIVSVFMSSAGAVCCVVEVDPPFSEKFEISSCAADGRAKMKRPHSEASREAGERAGPLGLTDRGEILPQYFAALVARTTHALMKAKARRIICDGPLGSTWLQDDPGGQGAHGKPVRSVMRQPAALESRDGLRLHLVGPPYVRPASPRPGRPG
jgi:hypothetical protein